MSADTDAAMGGEYAGAGSDVPMELDSQAPPEAVATGGDQAARPQALDPAKIKHWIALYPCYLDVNLPVNMGRRLPKEDLKDCVDPHIAEIVESLLRLGFRNIAIEVTSTARDSTPFHEYSSLSTIYIRCILKFSQQSVLFLQQQKRHPKHMWRLVGRVRVELKTKEGVLNVPTISSKHTLLQEIAKLLPHTPYRARRIANSQHAQQQFLQQKAAADAAAAKKNKKKR
jgi:signal recognition particle subunit SEC65